MNRNIRDVLSHLHHWHLLMMDWYNTAKSEGRTRNTSKRIYLEINPELNRWICEHYCQTSLEVAKENLKSSFEQIREVIESHSDEELFEKKRYKWTGTTSFGAYLVSATSSHYDWALKLIKKAKN